MSKRTSNRGVSWDMRTGAHPVRRRVVAAATVGLTAMALAPGAALADPGNANGGPPQSVIIEYAPGSGGLFSSVSDLVDSVLPPGQAHKFTSINAAEAKLNEHWISALEAAGATVVPDEAVAFQSTDSTTSASTTSASTTSTSTSSSSTSSSSTSSSSASSSSTSASTASCPSATTYSPPTGNFPTDTGANQLATAGDTGQGTTVAVLDTGIDAALPDFGGRVIGGVDLTGGNSPFTDQYGHGTFVAGLVAGNGASSNGQYAGEAPGADLVSIKVAGASGATSTSTIIHGIDWAIKNQNRYGIDVLNLSLGAMPTGPTATEPLDQAVEAAWNSGIAVVVSAGNSGPFNGTILSPGDDPLAITVGAFADNNSTAPANWAACPFSSVGPTEFDGWLKPDLVAPGRSVVSLMAPGSTVALANPQAQIGSANFVGSGTSFSSAITAGAAALVLADNPGISPNEVKGRLLGDAMPGELGNPMVEGHGFLNAFYSATGPAMVYNQAAAAQAERWWVFSPVSLNSVWSVSSWNPSNWNGSSWNGSSWNGSSWNGSSWNGSSWNGSSWNGSSWNGSSWNGSSWNGSSWNGSSWNGSSWNGSSWNGSSWNGSSWNGSSWNGSSWNGSSWNSELWA
ncbi:MAG TPA: S8 family peptidase [Acidimicrobiales bacterium]|nr:S8 family peptidase [Acidimicrobiales bacterium]